MKFADLNVGDEFKHNNVPYVKTEPEKISCCKVLNARNLENNGKVMIKPNDEVEKVASEQQ